MEENHSIQQIFPSGMPYLWSLAQRYAYATDWSDVAHPSLPNYLAIFGGSDFNDPQDCAPGPGCTYPGPSVFGQALSRGETAKAYEESMPQPCDQGFVGEYDVNHNPWAYFPSEAASCRADDVPAGTPASGALAGDVRGGTLPTVGLITPNLLHDGHDGTPARRTRGCAPGFPCSCRVLTGGRGGWPSSWSSMRARRPSRCRSCSWPPGLSGVKISEPANQYALTRLIDKVIGAPPLRQASSAAECSVGSRGSPMTGGRVIFVGAVHEAVPALGVLIDSEAEIVEVVTLPAARAASTSGFVDLEPLTRAHGIAVRRCADINSAESVRHVRELRPDLMVVTGWTRLLSTELLGVPSRGVVGFHASLLPRYRGRAPVNWAILRGATVTGNTMLYLDAGTDTGDIIDQQPVPITLDDTCATVYAKVGEAGAEMLRRHLRALLDGTAPRRPQGPADGPPLPKRTPGMGITDWNRPARAVHDWIRALTWPYPGAFTLLAEQKMMLWASAVSSARTGGRPGRSARLGRERCVRRHRGWRNPADQHVGLR